MTGHSIIEAVLLCTGFIVWAFIAVILFAIASMSIVFMHINAWRAIMRTLKRRFAK